MDPEESFANKKKLTYDIDVRTSAGILMTSARENSHPIKLGHNHAPSLSLQVKSVSLSSLILSGKCRDCLSKHVSKIPTILCLGVNEKSPLKREFLCVCSFDFRYFQYVDRARPK